MITCHAQKRLQQRGITPAILDAVLCYGEEAFLKNATSYSCSKESVGLMLSDGFDLKFVERCRGVYVVCRESLVITVCHKMKRLKNG